MSQGTIPHEERLSSNIVDLTKLCYDIVYDARDKNFKTIDPTMIDVAARVLDQWDKTDLINRFITKSCHYWDQIRTKDEEFFKQNMASVFDGLPTANVNAVSQLFSMVDPQTNQRVVAVEDREAVWEFLISMVKICIKYIHQRREPTLYRVGGEFKPFYKKEFFPEVPLEKHAQKFDVKLIFK